MGDTPSKQNGQRRDDNGSQRQLTADEITRIANEIAQINKVEESVSISRDQWEQIQKLQSVLNALTRQSTPAQVSQRELDQYVHLLPMLRQQGIGTANLINIRANITQEPPNVNTGAIPRRPNPNAISFHGVQHQNETGYTHHDKPGNFQKGNEKKGCTQQKFNNQDWQKNKKGMDGTKPVQHPGQKPMQHPGPKPMQHPGPKPMQHPGQKPMQHPGPKPMQHPGPNPRQQKAQNNQQPNHKKSELNANQPAQKDKQKQNQGDQSSGQNPGPGKKKNRSQSKPREKTDPLTNFIGAKDFMNSLASEPYTLRAVPCNQESMRQVMGSNPNLISSPQFNAPKGAAHENTVAANYNKTKLDFKQNNCENQDKLNSKQENFMENVEVIKSKFYSLPNDQIRANLPKDWALCGFPMLNKHITVPLDPTSQEYFKIHALFIETAQKEPEIKVKEILRVENAFLWHFYNKRKHALAYLLGGEPREREFFHGTRDTHAVLENGFGWKNPFKSRPKFYNHRLALTPKAAHACLHSVDSRVVVARCLQSSSDCAIQDLLTGVVPSVEEVTKNLDEFSSYPAFVIEFEGRVVKPNPNNPPTQTSL